MAESGLTRADLAKELKRQYPPFRNVPDDELVERALEIYPDLKSTLGRPARMIAASRREASNVVGKRENVPYASSPIGTALTPSLVPGYEVTGVQERMEPLPYRPSQIGTKLAASPISGYETVNVQERMDPLPYAYSAIPSTLRRDDLGYPTLPNIGGRGTLAGLPGPAIPGPPMPADLEPGEFGGFVGSGMMARLPTAPISAPISEPMLPDEESLRMALSGRGTIAGLPTAPMAPPAAPIRPTYPAIPHVGFFGRIRDLLRAPSEAGEAGELMGTPLLRGGAPSPSGGPIITGRGDWLKEALGNFLYALGSGMQASAGAPRGMGPTAAFGAALTAPMQLQMMRQQQGMDQSYRMAQMGNFASQEAHRQALALHQQAQEDEANRRNDIAERRLAQEAKLRSAANESSLARAGLKHDDQGNVVAIPRVELSETAKARIANLEDLQDLRSSLKELADARTAVAKSELDPNSPHLKLQRERLATANRRTQILAENLGLRELIFERETFGTVRGEPVPGAPSTAAGGPVGLRTYKLTETARKYYDAPMDADNRLSIMAENAKRPSPQGDVALLFNHIGMTLGAQKGARITNAEIDRAAKTRSLPEGAIARLQSWGIAPDVVYAALGQDPGKLPSGAFLSPRQRENMVRLAVEMRERQWNKARRAAKLHGYLEEPEQDPTLPPLGPQATVGKATGARISVIAPDGRRGTVPVSQLPDALKQGYKRAQ